MKYLFVALALITVSTLALATQTNFNLQPGVYKGEKMGLFIPLSLGQKSCQVEILKTYKESDVLVKFEGQIEILKYEKEEEVFKTVRYEKQFMGTESVPAMTLFKYTDGLAFGSSKKTWDCVMLKREK